jgi:hypothetical protein
MILHAQIDRAALRALITAGLIQFGGNQRLLIYGTLKCASGKRMQRQNRVFFADAAEAVAQGYRPCGHCQRAAYKTWKAGCGG